MSTLSATPLLDIRHVDQRYRNASGEGDIVILDDVNLSLSDGEIVGLLGRSGCGKSSLLRIVSGLVSRSSYRLALVEDVTGTGAHKSRYDPQQRGLTAARSAE